MDGQPTASAGEGAGRTEDEARKDAALERRRWASGVWRQIRDRVERCSRVRAGAMRRRSPASRVHVRGVARAFAFALMRPRGAARERCGVIRPVSDST